MMNILLSPQVRENNKIWYEIDQQIIKATINDVTDTFDFSDMPDGKMQMYDDEGEIAIESTLDEVPILEAIKNNGKLEVTILFSIDPYEQDERLLFPDPMSLGEFNELMSELSKRKDGSDGEIPMENE